MGLRERALGAWVEEEKDRKDAQERTDVGLFKRAREHFSKAFGVEPEVVKRTSHGVEVRVGGMRFLFNVMTKTCWLWGECPECGWHCWSSRGFQTLGEMGRVIAEFKPEGHKCGEAEGEPEDSATALRKAMKSFLAEEG